MSREATFICPYDIPRNSSSRFHMKSYMESIQPGIGVFGDEGQDVGLGFLWETQAGVDFIPLATLTRRMQRMLRTSGILSPRAGIYFLGQRVKFVRDGDPKVTFTLKEE